MSSHLGLLMLLVKDITREKAFYTEYLGFEVVSEFSGDDFVMLRSRTNEGTTLALSTVGSMNGAQDVPLTHGGIIPGFAVEDADATYQQWKAKGVEILGEINDIGAGHSFTARDPESHYIQVFHLYPQVIEMQKKMGMRS